MSPNFPGNVHSARSIVLFSILVCLYKIMGLLESPRAAPSPTRTTNSSEPTQVKDPIEKICNCEQNQKDPQDLKQPVDLRPVELLDHDIEDCPDCPNNHAHQKHTDEQSEKPFEPVEPNTMLHNCCHHFCGSSSSFFFFSFSF